MATDVRIWINPIATLPLEDLVLTTGGEEVATTTTAIRLATDHPHLPRLGLLSPVAELAPNTEYEIVSLAGMDHLASFTTGDGPGPQTVTVGEPEAFPVFSKGCRQRILGVRIHAAHDGDFLVVDREGESSLVTDPLGGVVSTIYPADEALLGVAPCEHSWPDVQRGDRASVRVGALSITGRFSGWSDPFEVEAP